MLLVRQATVEDRNGIFALLKELLGSTGLESPINQPGALEAYRQIIEDHKGTFLVAEEGENLLGLISLSYPIAVRCGGIYACIEEFIVSEKARGKGAGSRLLEAAKRKAAQMGCHEVQVNRPSEIGYPIYIHHGWKDLGKHLSLYPARSKARAGNRSMDLPGETEK
jgi:N-acetylglutamate synthase-like GNAT family acetyltransferase